MISTGGQHVWALVFTILVASFIAAVVGGIIGYFIVGRSSSVVPELHPVQRIKEIVNPPYDPYPERPIDLSRYRRSDEEIERTERMRSRVADNPALLLRLDLSSQDNELKHIDGVPWHDAELPPANHRCWPQTDAWIMFRQVQRCACGAIRESDYPTWDRVNERRKDQS